MGHQEFTLETQKGKTASNGAQSYFDNLHYNAFLMASLHILSSWPKKALSFFKMKKI